ncbi:hypothetical protein ASPZODRAFT_1114005 [Penicilliopsis zonata CBS 506.65]|uniref:Uncharacterized protein n=1 Tax=Penicilliopsis zonata CBS 506.65 TaxID=1073090 RepID=A0A1L9SSF0_9EURO|nr:hypothetical protein ASPZODRAFT_1114005 [Penicilliopsis zonata CBS 506.65]OJJ50130.1 hypothetical protein ASPZODRAFT_1114005 [Penicilliopsis zonata CBS 506.65]
MEDERRRRDVEPESPSQDGGPASDSTKDLARKARTPSGSDLRKRIVIKIRLRSGGKKGKRRISLTRCGRRSSGFLPDAPCSRLEIEQLSDLHPPTQAAAIREASIGSGHVIRYSHEPLLLRSRPTEELRGIPHQLVTPYYGVLRTSGHDCDTQSPLLGDSFLYAFVQPVRTKKIVARVEGDVLAGADCVEPRDRDRRDASTHAAE